MLFIRSKPTGLGDALALVKTLATWAMYAFNCCCSDRMESVFVVRSAGGIALHSSADGTCERWIDAMN